MIAAPPDRSYDPAECIDPKVMAGLFKKSVSWVYTMARQGRIPAVRVGGSWLFPRRLIERWLEASGEVETMSAQPIFAPRSGPPVHGGGGG